jgi:hypothetical protein
MALKITNILGAMQKQQHLFDNEKDIAIGRDPDECQVLYPADFTTVGRKHLVISEDAGRYELRVNTKNPVYLDGVLAEDDIELPDSCTIALGNKKGPSFKVERIDNQELPKTMDYGSQKEIHSKVKRSSRWLKIALLLIVVVGGGFGFQAWQTQQRIDQMNQQAGEAFSELYKNMDNDIGKIASSLSSSVYLVLVKGEDGETPMGTAWVATDNALATNSHVAQIFHDIPKDRGFQFIVRSTVAPYHEHVIDSVIMHPAYNEFAKAWQAAAPKLIGVNGSPEAVDFIPGYDVALLIPKSNEDLAKPMPLADHTTLTNLTSGMQVAYIGFPMEGVQKQVFSQPTPTIQVANITSITDFFRGQAPFSAAQMIQHSLPAIGGASGSPIINERGEVIALLNAGNVVGVNEKGERIPNAVAINYAQRVDLLMPLLETGDDFLIDDLVESWKKGFARFANQKQVSEVMFKSVARDVLSGWQDYLGIEKATEISKQEVIINDANRIDNIPAALVEFKAPKAGNYLIMAIDSEQGDIDLLVGKMVNGQFKVINRNTRSDFYPNLNVKLEKGESLGIYVLHRDLADSGQPPTKTQLSIHSD